MSGGTSGTSGNHGNHGTHGAYGRLPKVDPQRFGLNQLPAFRDASQAQALDADCCPNLNCVQRDYNRAAILALTRLSQGYAALLLLNYATTQVWPCQSETGHTEGCTNPSCTFGLQQATSLRWATDHLAQAITEIYRVIANTACDLTAYWQDLHDAEQAWFEMKNIAANGQLTEIQARAQLKDVLETWREMVADTDEDYLRWFTPPEVG